MKKVRLFEQFVNEAKVNKGKVHKAAKEASYPVTLVVIDGKKVVHQELVETPMAVPASMSVLKDKYPNLKIHVESKTGEVVFVQESAEINEGQYLKKLDRLAVKFEGEMGFATLSEDDMDKYINIDMANELAEEMFGEFGFATLDEDQMEKVLKKNPKIIK